MSANVKSKLESHSFRLMRKDEFRAFGELAGRAYSTDYPVYPYYFGESSTKEKIVSIFKVNYRSLFKVGTVIYSLALLNQCVETPILQDLRRMSEI